MFFTQKKKKKKKKKKKFTLSFAPSFLTICLFCKKKKSFANCAK